MEKSESAKIDIPADDQTSRERKGKAPLLGGGRGLSLSAPVGVGGGRYTKKRGIAIFDLVLRISAVAAALGATVAMGTADQTLPFFTQFFQFQASYDDLPTFSFFVIAMAIVSAYLVLSIPFSIVCIVRPHAIAPRLLLIIFDTLAVTLATSASGASAAIDYLAHNGSSDANWLAICQQFTDFCQKTSGAVVAGFSTVVLLIFLVVLSAIALRKHH
ncbi:hypothetical protein ACH5RR_004538 [Cinchona calisaya]|uniref:CASP-like protein n=1 Tax=Cinchona calisaya TaxID=153742 RepID=A0ABD3AXU3_9GENT